MEYHGWIMYPWHQADHAEYGTYHFEEPFYNNGYYLRLTMEFIKENPL